MSIKLPALSSITRMVFGVSTISFSRCEELSLFIEALLFSVVVEIMSDLIEKCININRFFDVAVTTREK